MIDKPSNFEELRKEFDGYSFRNMLDENLKQECANCGKTEMLEYHHVVPLALGGSNRISNIVCLCYWCHRQAHGCEKIHKLAGKENRGGRHRRKPVDNYQEIYDEYLTGKIGRKECERKLNLSEKSKLCDDKNFKSYLKDKGIVSHKNKIDYCKYAKRIGRQIKPTQIIAEIKYSDGKIFQLVYADVEGKLKLA